MNLASRVILGTAAVMSFAMLAGALLVHLILRAYLSPFASHFASMRSSLGWGPDLDTIYGLVDQTLAVAFGIAILLGVLIGLLVGRELSRSVLVIGHGLARFARGSFDQPIPPVGPPELTRVAQNANEMARALERAQRAERELAAGVAHDLAHPLTAMRGTLEALRDGLIAPGDAGMTARLLTDVGTMGETLEDLRDVAAAEAGRLRLEFRDVDVGEVVTRIATSYADLAARKGIVLDPGSAESIVARTDERRLTRIVTNLLINALQATPPDGRVAVRVCRRPASIAVAVEDGAGSGAGTAIRSALAGNGSGLGLRVVAVLGQALGAQLAVEDAALGAVVELRLPH
jgi:two-component system, OmpR family, sensor histidine kinase BaeS